MFSGLIVILSMLLVLNSINTNKDCYINRVSDGNCCITPSETDIITNITLILNFHDGENVSFYDITLVDDITAFNATIVAIGEENISYYSAINGVFITGMCINGTWYTNGDGSRNWLYYVNGLFAGISCSFYELNNDSVVEWVFKGGNPYDGNGEPNKFFWLYTGIFIGVAVACGLGIYFIIKRGV